MPAHIIKRNDDLQTGDSLVRDRKVLTIERLVREPSKLEVITQQGEVLFLDTYGLSSVAV